MGTRFTRVTVVGDGRQIDVSLPGDTPLAVQLPTVLRLLSVPTGPVPVRWRLAAPEFGAIDPARSLDQVGVLDGTVLHLTEAAAAPLPPYVDDVESAVADLVADSAPRWIGAARRSAVGTLLALVLLAALLLAVGSPASVSWVSAALVAAVALVAGRVIRERGGWICALVAVPALAWLAVAIPAARSSMLGAGVVPPASFPSASTPASRAGGPTAAAAGESLTLVLAWHGFPLALVVAGAIATSIVGAVRRAPGPAVGSLAVAGAGAGALLCIRYGLPPDRTAGLTLVSAVLLAGLAGQVALGRAGLVALMVADEQGQAVPRDVVHTAVRRGLSMTGGMLWAAAVLAAPACWVLLTVTPGNDNRWAAPALGLLGGLIFSLRSRMFSRAQHVGTMLVPAVVVVIATTVAGPRWLGLTSPSASLSTVVLLLLIGLLGAASGLGSLREVAAARLQRNLERLELVAMLALVPGLVLLFRVIPMVQRLWH